MRAAVIALLAAGVVLLPGAASSTASGSDVERGVAVYAVVATDTSVGPEGEETVRTQRGDVRVACVAAECRVVSEPGFGFLGGVPLTVGETIGGEDAEAAAGDPCTIGHGERALTVSARIDGFTATLTQEPVDWTACPDGSEGYAHARTIVWEGTPVAVDPCLFTPTACTVTAGTASRLASGDPAAPSVLSALVPPTEVVVSPASLLTTALLTVILVLLVAFPSGLLNRAVEAGADRLVAWRRTRAPHDGAAEKTPRWRTSWWWAASGVLAASVVSAFVDPQFGFNPGSARVVLSLLVSFAVDIVLGWVLVIWVMSRFHPGVGHDYSFRPASLLVVVAAVIFTRVTGFEPGIVFGLVAGVAFASLPGAAAKARSTLVTMGFAFVASLIAWVLYGLTVPGIGDSVPATLIAETLAGITVGGISSLPLALLPIGGLPGRGLWVWRRGVWAGCYATGLLAFFVILLPLPFSWAEVEWELWAWVGMYAVYAGVAVVAWLVLTRPWRTAAKVTDGVEEEGVESAAGDRVET
ncbi:MAG: hypothetical protein P0Y48_03165 [Candidatus Microbacterium phytovorans]|uniref:Uncharacterized protein n=1 Tax=Candidatus Microbacterium phytovorans TaxID=3121374 RepID=A0AAJ6B4D5_9MICO|nr:hypothetical protein [Microbacterium sp.]WEK14227.1 MAG: hypothetical protein P0Y48_03165 [Microbacterium sp.]